MKLKENFTSNVLHLSRVRTVVVVVVVVDEYVSAELVTTLSMAMSLRYTLSSCMSVTVHQYSPS